MNLLWCSLLSFFGMFRRPPSSQHCMSSAASEVYKGQVVELDRLAGEPLDVLVNGTLIAHGEVVMVNDKFGIRLTDVVSQSERIQRLR